MTKKNNKTRGLNKQCHYSYNYDYVDYDYAAKLTPEEAEWLANFSDNYYSGRFKVDDEKNPIKDRTNAYKGARERRRDIMNAKRLSRSYGFGDFPSLEQFLEYLDTGKDNDDDKY